MSPASPTENTHSVLIIDMFHYDSESEYTIEGFPTLELAREFARRWVRDSLEEFRKPGQTGNHPGLPGAFSLRVADRFPAC